MRSTSHLDAEKLNAQVAAVLFGGGPIRIDPFGPRARKRISEALIDATPEIRRSLVEAMEKDMVPRLLARDAVALAETIRNVNPMLLDFAPLLREIDAKFRRATRLAPILAPENLNRLAVALERAKNEENGGEA